MSKVIMFMLGVLFVEALDVYTCETKGVLNTIFNGAYECTKLPDNSKGLINE